MIDTYLAQVVSCDHGISLPRYLPIIDNYQNIEKVLWVTVHDLQGFDARRETAWLDSVASSVASLAFNASLSAPLPQDTWRETAVQIPVPDSKRHDL